MVRLGPASDPGAYLIDACRRCDLSDVRKAVSHGADVNLILNDEMRPPLILAQAMLGRARIVRELAALGADVNATDAAGFTAVMRAVQFYGAGDNLAAIDELIRAGADLNAVNRLGSRALDYAVPPPGPDLLQPKPPDDPTEEDVVRLLVRHGATSTRRGTNAYVRRLLGGEGRSREP